MNAHSPTLQPLGMPKGMDPRQWRQSVEKRLNDLLDRAMSLITALDMMEVDCDDEDSHDAEPSEDGETIMCPTAWSRRKCLSGSEIPLRAEFGPAGRRPGFHISVAEKSRNSNIRRFN